MPVRLLAREPHGKGMNAPVPRPLYLVCADTISLMDITWFISGWPLAHEPRYTVTEEGEAPKMTSDMTAIYW
jgi:hypothetical protein